MSSKILVVDDKQENVELLKALLRRSGYPVITAFNGREALEKVKEEKPDLILLDVMMPILDGFQTCRILKEDVKTRRIPIVMLTAKTERKDKILGLDTGADDYITKPFERDELLARVRSLLRIKDLNDRLEVANQQLAEKQKALEEELQQGRKIQMSMLPLENPKIHGYDIVGVCIPAQEVGGDYYDFIFLSENQLSIAIGDVVGKGVPAALLMAMAKSCLYTQTAIDPDIIKVLNALNRTIQDMTRLNPRIFMTFLYSIIHCDSHVLEFSNAGHCFPYYYSSQTGELNFLSATSMPLGISKTPQTPQFGRKEVKLLPGDVLIFYSDGIIEAKNLQNEIYSFERFENSIKTFKHLSATELCGAILADVEKHSADMPQSDDITLVVIKRV